MRELEYPFDANYLLRKKKKIKKELLEHAEGYISTKIAILGGATTSNIMLMMELFLLNQGIQPTFYESEYNMFFEDAMYDPKELIDFQPDVIYICTSIHNIKEFPGINDSRDLVQEKLQRVYHSYFLMWEHLNEVYHCPVIQNNFEQPAFRLLGNRDIYDYRGRSNFVFRLNEKFYEYAEEHKDLYICDINYLSSIFGLQKWSNGFDYNMYKYAQAVSATPHVAFQVSNIIKSIYGKNKKGLVLDLDNTLWGGVIGDDGVDNISLGPETAEGEAFVNFQQYLKELSEMGILLNVDSKNEMENAKAGLQHPDGRLKEEDFIIVKANWEPKDQNFKAIAEELNLLPESLVFVDDNPAERHIVNTTFPKVSTPEISDVNKYIEYIDQSGFFEVTEISEDDKNRNQMYRENAKRKSLEASVTNYSEYLKSLEMKAEIEEFQSIYYSRITQLTNKSNQFNLTTKRYTREEIETIAESDSYICLYGKLEDRFGDNGVVSVVIGEICENICHIRLWLMSCRVLKRDMEFAMMDALVQRCKEKGIDRIMGYYYPTAKNKMVQEFYKTQMFELVEMDADGNSSWVYKIPEEYRKKNHFIEV